MPRESADEKLRRMIQEAIAGERQRADDEANPQIGTLRRIVREELSDVLGGLLNDRGDRGRRQRDADDAEDDNAFSLGKLLGG